MDDEPKICQISSSINHHLISLSLVGLRGYVKLRGLYLDTYTWRLNEIIQKYRNLEHTVSI